MGTDVALLNGGSIRINDNIPPGPITEYELEGIFYYTNRLVAFPLTGRQLLDMLNISVKEADSADGRFLQVSGVRFAYTQRDGKFVVDAADVTVAGKPLDLDATYSVASTDFMHERGAEDDYVIFATEATRPPRINTDREADFRTTVEKAIRARGTIDTNVEGRIVRR
jgi:5'-nucleotidase